MLYKKDGVTHVIIVYRNDDWGKGLADFVKAICKEFGITIVDKIPYDPKAPAFGALVETVRAKVRELTQVRSFKGSYRTYSVRGGCKLSGRGF
jgi:ABC-type branched-subunit amino acid transport system substrate-binding protein